MCIPYGHSTHFRVFYARFACVYNSIILWEDQDFLPCLEYIHITYLNTYTHFIHLSTKKRQTFKKN